ncbi:hypothetical protein AMD24_00089 [Candidatus Xiphinematobacter sp. Idaho Grape]|nr:hypothetical protein AMD24_00089 [Candidatus Xiphinematobacter sp. Idaho Grape]
MPVKERVFALRNSHHHVLLSWARITFRYSFSDRLQIDPTLSERGLFNLTYVSKGSLRPLT